MARLPSLRVLGALGATSLAFGACKREDPDIVELRGAATSSAPSRPLDHLAPGELAIGDSDVFGLPVPREMQVLGRAPDSAILLGEVTPEALAEFVRDRVVVSHVEVSPERTVFPNAKIKDGPPDRVFRIEVTPDRRYSRLTLRDVTPVQPKPGLTDAERWRRAGFSPDGRPLDLKRLE
jgi:hypothetical protein